MCPEKFHKYNKLVIIYDNKLSIFKLGLTGKITWYHA